MPETFDLFTHPDALHMLSTATPQALDAVDVGLIGFAADGIVVVYNRHESAASGLAPAAVIGHHVFTDIAQCMNNFLVAQRFADAVEADRPLDVTLDYVLTWRMRPTPVQLRLLWAPGETLRWLLLRRALAAGGDTARAHVG